MDTHTFDLLIMAFAAPVAVLLLFYGVEDMALDLVYYHGGWKRTNRVLSLEQLRSVPKQRIAMMVPAWQESDVIDRMLETAYGTLQYDRDKFHIFVGTYRNDPETRVKVQAVAERIATVHECCVPHDGPTSKADCLNTVWGCIQEYEREQGFRFDVLLMHDAEDVIHPFALLHYNYWIPRYDFVQTPVLPLPVPLWQLVAGTYIDEFSEFHLKDMIVRGQIKGLVPSAGVGSAFARKSFDEVSRSYKGKPFDVESLTEDYEVGLKMRLNGKSTYFACDWVEYEQVRDGKTVKTRELIATREYFPTNLRASIRQRSRWVCGIAFKTWDRLGWQGPIPVLYSLYRDRRALFAHTIALSAYLVLAVCIGRWITGLITGEPWYFTNVFAPGSLLTALVTLNAIFAVWRLVVKVLTVHRVYPWGLSLMSVIRSPLANFIGFAATASAGRQYLIHRITRRPLRWKKTAHQFPTGMQALTPAQQPLPTEARPS